MSSVVTTQPAASTQNGLQVSDKPATDSAPLVETALVTTQGKTSISDVVVEKIAGMATREISGVYKLGGGAARAFGAIRELIKAIRRNVISAIERMTTLEVTEVNIVVHDVHIPSDDDAGDTADARV